MRDNIHDFHSNRGHGADFRAKREGGRGGFAAGFGPGFGGGFGPGFGPRGMGGPRGRAGRGDVRGAILSLLAEAPSNGYGLIKAIVERSEGAWRASPGSVYPTLQQLVDEGLIESTSSGRGTEYALTDEGRAWTAEHEDELGRVWSDVERPGESVRGLFESAGKLMQVSAQFRHGVTDDRREAARAKLDEARKALYLILAE